MVNDKINSKDNDNRNLVSISPLTESVIATSFKKAYLSEDYENYILFYFGNIIEAFKNIDYALVYSMGPLFTLAVIKRGMIGKLLEDVPEIYYAEKSFPYNLSNLENMNNGIAYKFMEEENIELKGQGVIVGIISTGIDYLNERFMTDSKQSRIMAIWDQTIEKDKISTLPFFYGTEYLKEDINKAIETKNAGGDPYTIVEHKDNSGYGTALAGIIGGRKLYPEDSFTSIVPKCEYAIVKLKEAKKSTLEMNGVGKVDVPVYEATDIRTAIVYLAQLQYKENKPMVIYLPLGTNIGGHDGASPIEDFVDYYSDRKGLAIVTDTGSQGNTETHTSGVIQSVGDMQAIEINVGEEQENLYVSIWFEVADKASISIVPPVGNPIEKIPPLLLDGEELIYKIGESTARVQFFLSTTNGIEFINIMIWNVTSGLWKINVIGEYIVDGRYDSWLYQRELLRPGTKFLKPDPFITLTLPSTANKTFSNSFFNSNTGLFSERAGKGYTKDDRIEPEVCCPGTNILTTSNKGENIIVSGAGAAGAILTGGIALILQWGIVLGNDKNLYTPKIKTYLIRSVERIPNVEYPNRECGYGRLSVNKLFDVLLGRCSEVDKVLDYYVRKDENKENKLFIKVPYDIYKKVEQ